MVSITQQPSAASRGNQMTATANQTASRQPPFVQALVPVAPLYIVMRDFGKIGFESVSDPDATRASIISDIASGQIDRIAYVIELFPHEFSSRDITNEIYEAVHAAQHQQAAE